MNDEKVMGLTLITQTEFERFVHPTISLFFKYNYFKIIFLPKNLDYDGTDFSGVKSSAGFVFNVEGSYSFVPQLLSFQCSFTYLFMLCL